MLNTALIRRLKKRDLVEPNLAAIARKIGKSRTWVSLVWNRRQKSRKTQELIAEALGIPYEELWEK
ncbi:helix-turn-helix domain-containing protein [Thermodesulfovibrio yellowstonii]|uniref:helix-turn-helix domain-containing protein n=1 Tax=Thermodesulfovibrio yellowstonii TaxID=28262 RepID=UPI003D17E6EE